MSNEMALMREIAKLQEQINALRTIEIGGVWQDWTPTYSAGGSMTFTSVTTNEARYCVVGKFLHYKIFATGTIGGTAHTDVYFTIPVSRSNTVAYMIAGHGIVNDSGDKVAFVAFLGTSPNTIRVRNLTSSNFGLGASKSILIAGSIEIA
jgi:hypothetical protein